MLGHNLNQITFYRWNDERNCYMKSVLMLRLNNVIIKNENSLENIQTGSGTEEDSKKPLHRPDNSDFQTIDHGHLESIVNLVVEKLKSQYGLQPLPQQPSRVQSGGGSLDTFPLFNSKMSKISHS